MEVIRGEICVESLERWQGRVLKWMAGLSILVHAAVLLLGSSISALFPPKPLLPVVTVELTEPPLSELPEEKPAPPPVEPKPVTAAKAETPPARTPARPRPPSSEQWLKKLDAGLARVQEAPVSRDMGKAGGIPVRRWEDDAAPRPADFAPAVAPENKALLKQIAALEGKIRSSGIPGIGTGEEIEASVMFGGVGDDAGEPIPAWVRDMIRRIVRDHLPELEAAYSKAYRGDPGLKGRLLVRFRIDSSGKVVLAEPGGTSFQHDAFIEVVLSKVRGWSFEPTGGRTVEVLYPFVFIAPS